MAARALAFSVAGAAVFAAAISVLAYQSEALIGMWMGGEGVALDTGGRPPTQVASADPAAIADPGAPSGPVRTETMVFDAWRVACRESGGAAARKLCSATLSLQMVEKNRRQVLGAWLIGRNNEGTLFTVLQTPMFRTQASSAGILIRKGVELKLGDGAARKLAYSACEPQRCEAATPMDDEMVREVLGAPSATITVYNKDGTALNINVPSIKGIDKALAAVGS
jgi:invasion protein IalB